MKNQKDKALMRALVFLMGLKTAVLTLLVGVSLIVMAAGHHGDGRKTLQPPLQDVT